MTDEKTMETNKLLMKTLYKMNLVRVNLEKENAIIKMKLYETIQEYKKCKENESIIKALLEKKNNHIEKFIEQNAALMEEIRNLKQEFQERDRQLNLREEKSDEREKINELQTLKDSNDNLLKEIRELKQEPVSSQEVPQPSPLYHHCGTQGLLDATKKGNFVAVQYWSLNPPVDSGKNTPLHLAAMGGFDEILQFFCNKKMNLELKNQYGKTPLHCAAENNFFNCVKILIENGANVESLDKGNNTPLLMACQIENIDLELIKYLLSKGANVEAIDNSGNRPMHKTRNVAVLKLLVEKGADISAIGYEGKTPLHYAYEQNYLENIEYLISSGANQDIRDHLGRLPKESKIIPPPDATTPATNVSALFGSSTFGQPTRTFIGPKS